MSKQFIYWILILFLFVDIGYSFFQYLHIPIDGDLTSIILPSPSYEPLMQDPLAMGVWLENKIYASPNRYFAHWFTATYFRNVPIFLQKFMSPIESVYFSAAIIKVIIQVLLLGLLAYFISGKRKIWELDFILAAALMAPLFHTTGYYIYMGVIDHAVTYALFYALPISLLMIFFLPFYEKLFFQRAFRWTIPRVVFLCFLTFYLSLNGPIIAPVLLLVVGLMGISFLIKKRKTDGSFFSKNVFAKFQNHFSKQGFFLLIVFVVFALYSFFIGTNTEEGLGHSISLMERYQRLPAGVFNIIFTKVGFPILLVMIGGNIFLMKKKNTPESQRIIQFLKWAGLFALLYILLLPIGGYRGYRPNIIRRDTFIPITLCIFYAYGITSFYVMKHIFPKYKNAYFILLLLIAINFMVVDLPITGKNQCEKDALKKISESKGDVIGLDNDCLIMTWFKVENPEFTKTNSEVFQLWNITDDRVLYFQK